MNSAAHLFAGRAARVLVPWQPPLAERLSTPCFADGVAYRVFAEGVLAYSPSAYVVFAELYSRTRALLHDSGKLGRCQALSFCPGVYTVVRWLLAFRGTLNAETI